MFTAQDLKALLADATPDTIVHLTYRAGGKPATEIARRERREASDWQKPCQDYTGNFVGFSSNKWKETVLTLWVHNRGKVGNYRAFNPTLGEVLAVKVVRP